MVLCNWRVWWWVSGWCRARRVDNWANDGDDAGLIAARAMVARFKPSNSIYNSGCKLAVPRRMFLIWILSYWFCRIAFERTRGLNVTVETVREWVSYGRVRCKVVLGEKGVAVEILLCWVFGSLCIWYVCCTMIYASYQKTNCDSWSEWQHHQIRWARSWSGIIMGHMFGVLRRDNSKRDQHTVYE